MTAAATEFVPTTQSELARFVAENATAARQALQPVGGRTALHCGFAGRRADVVVDLRELRRVVDYPARDMTVTVEAGLRVDELKQLLATEGQQLPVDIAQSSRATIGGAIATNTSGHRRFGYGSFRDYLIGLSAVDAAGQLFKAGGRVVKNVAGYDLCKLLVGSRGTLAILTQVTLKLRPLPQHTGWWWIAFDTLPEIENALVRLSTSAARPVALEVLNPAAARLIAGDARLNVPTQSPVLCLAVEGSEREVAWQLDALRKELVPLGVQQFDRLVGPGAGGLAAALTEFAVCADDPLTFQASLRPSRCLEFAEAATRRGIAVQCHAGNGIVIGQFPEEAASWVQAKALCDDLLRTAVAADGNLQILHCDPEWQDRLPMLGAPEPSWPLMVQLKQRLDPQGLLNPGQFVDGAGSDYNPGAAAVGR